MGKRPEKNSERVEVRVPHSLKQRFLAACQTAGDTPSAVLRNAMSDYITRLEAAEQPNRFEEFTMKLIRNPLKAASITLTSLAAFTLMAAPSSADERLFKALDSNGDGVLTETDTAPHERVIFVLDEDHSHSITLDEFRTVAHYGRLFSPKPIDGTFRAMAKRITLDEDGNLTALAGSPDITFADETGHAGLPADNAASTIVSLVTIDLSVPGEVRFKSENVTMDELAQREELDHIVVEIEGDLPDR